MNELNEQKQATMKKLNYILDGLFLISLFAFWYLLIQIFH